MATRRLPPRTEGFAPRTTRTTRALAVVVVLVAVVGGWLLNGRDPGTGSDPGVGHAASGSASTSPSVPTRSAAPDADTAVDAESGLPYVDLADLPPEAFDTVDLIDAGPPYPFSKDGSTFGNYEGLLPDRERGYYEEFTVVTPGSDDRGARRVIAGDDGQLYWTADHYDSFERIRR